jgi:uroporphyrinogen-III synthase
VLHAGAEETRPGLSAVEQTGRARFRHLPVYRTRSAPALPWGEREELDVAVVRLASPSAAAGLAGRARVPARAQIVTIGPSTTAAAREAGLRVAGEAVTRDLHGLLRAIPRERPR